MQRKILVPCAVVLVALAATGILAADKSTNPIPSDKTLITDGSMAHTVGELWNHVTNWGLTGSRPTVPSTFSDSPSGYYLGVHHLWSAGFWVGGVVLGERLVSTGQYESEIMATDDVVDIIYETAGGAPGGARYPWPGADDDNDGEEDEEILDGRDNDGDGLIDEDFAAVGNEHFSCVMWDTTALSRTTYPDHTPLNIRVVQQTFQWSEPAAATFIGYEYTVTNIGVADIDRVHCGMFADFDINLPDDDQTGSWRGDVQVADGRFVPVTLAWMRDAGTPVWGGYMGWVMCGLVTNAAGGGPADPLAVGTYQRFAGQLPFDQGGDPTNDDERYQLLSATPDYWDPDSIHPNDYRLLLTTGEVPVLAPGESLTYRMALVGGVDLEDLVANAAEAVATALGQDFDRDEDPANGDEFNVPWLRQSEVPVPNITGDLRAASADGGVTLVFDLEGAEDLVVAVVRRSGPGVPGRRWDRITAAAAGGVRDDDPVAWPRTYDLVLATARGTELVLDTVVVPGPQDAGLAMTAAPNPFNPQVTIHFTLPRSSPARLDVLDLQGNLVRTLFQEDRPAGPGQEVWNGRDARGRDVASGVYLVRLRSDDGVTGQRVTLLR